MKLLNVTTVGMTQGFFTELFKELKDEGHEVHLACNETLWDMPEKIKALNLPFHHIDCQRTPFSVKNIQTVKEIRVLYEEIRPDVVHCHTPVAAVLTRIALRKYRKKYGVRVVYTAHGFHFYKGSSLLSWLIYYPVEKICAKYTDVLVTINKEDYELAKRKFSSSCKVEYVPGVGIDTRKFADACSAWTKEDFVKKRVSLGIPEDAFFLLSVGELNENKNHSLVLKAIAEMNENIHYAIAGIGEKKDELISLAKDLGIADRVHLLGFRSDVAELYKTADALIHPSIREGLPVTIMECLAAGTPVIASGIRGNVDLVLTDYTFTPVGSNAINECKIAINRVIGKNPSSADVSQYDKFCINQKIKKIYGICSE